ncbi:MAG: helix-turn-helix transcriptional regulator [Adlercreutzia mucosicola]|nr:helix-turn-helix transcriptional regulator [Adlercreutzia mucosicola]
MSYISQSEECSRRRSLGQLMTMVRSGRAMATALTLFNGWVFAMSWSGVFQAPFSERESAFVLHGLWLTSLLVCTFTLLVFLCLPRRWRVVRLGGLRLAAGCMVLSTALSAASHGWAQAGVPLFFASGMASGLGTGIMSAYWGRLITRYDAGAVMQFVAVSLAGAALVTLAVAAMPRFAAYGAMALAPLFMAFNFARAADLGVDAHGAPRSVGVCGVSPDRAPVADERLRSTSAIPASLIMFFVLAVVLGVSAGLLRVVTDADVAAFQRAVVFGLATLGAALMLLLSKVPGEGESFALFYRAIAFIAGAFVVLTVVVQQAAYQSVLALGLHTMGYMYFYGLLWVFCAMYAQQNRDAAGVFVAGFFANQIGQVIGAWAGGSLRALLDAGSFISTASNAMIYVLLFVVIALMARLSAGRPPETAAARPLMSLATDEGMAVACARATERFGLTPREAEILPYLVRGYDRGYIAEMLVVSPETVKSHTRHIYEKMTVHTRVELFNAVTLCLEE